MIVMINGAFGSGKTSVAYMLQSVLSNSLIYDPEELGFMLRKLIPESVRLANERTDDFQDMELWRILTVQTAHEIKKKYKMHLIIPMTIYKTENFEYITNGLREIDAELHHFCLLASEETIHKRLQKRGDPPGGWSYQQAQKCTQALQNGRFEQFIATDEYAVDEVVTQIMDKLAIYQDC